MPKKKQEPAEEQATVAVQPSAPVEQVNSPPAHSSGYEPGDLLTINDSERGITLEDSDDVKWNYLAGAAARRLILTGVVSGLEGLDTMSPLCIVDYEGLRVVIPGRQMFMEAWPEDETAPKNVRTRLGRILGATIDFVLAGVDIRNRAAVASRKAALLRRQAQFYETGRVKEGIRVACRVIGVGSNRIDVEAIGVDTSIPANALSWEWFVDVADLYCSGDLVVARVMGVIKDEETGQFRLRLSVKAAADNPDLANLRKLVPGSNYFGVVTGVHDRLIFVRLQAGVNAKTKLYRTKELPSKFDTVSFQVRSVDEDSGVALGLITRIIRRHSRKR